MELAVGEALVSLLDEKGRPTVTERVYVLPPGSQIGPIHARTSAKALIAGSLVAGVYGKTVDRESAYETLRGRVASAPDAPPSAAAGKPTIPGAAPADAGGGIMGSLNDILFGTTGPRGGKHDGWRKPWPSRPCVPLEATMTAKSCGRLAASSARRRGADPTWPGSRNPSNFPGWRQGSRCRKPLAHGGHAIRCRACSLPAARWTFPACSVSLAAACSRCSSGLAILWWSPDPRMTLQVSQFRLHRSLAKTLRRFMADPRCEVRFDSQFESVIGNCSRMPRSGQSGTWIVPDMIDAYLALHRAGHAHSVETWVDGRMMGGLYCVAIGHAVFGESMFALQPDASKIALAALVAFCRSAGVEMIDCQQNASHLASLGACEIPRPDFVAHVSRASAQAPPTWRFDPLYWLQLLPARPFSTTT